MPCVLVVHNMQMPAGLDSPQFFWRLWALTTMFHTGFLFWINLRELYHLSQQETILSELLLVAGYALLGGSQELSWVTLDFASRNPGIHHIGPHNIT